MFSGCGGSFSPASQSPGRSLVPALDPAQDCEGGAGVSHRAWPGEGSVQPWATDVPGQLALTWLGLSSEEGSRS